MRYRRSALTARAMCERLDCRTLLAAGQLDPSFGGDGIVTVPDVAVFSDVAVQADGKVVAVGEGANLWRFLPDGTPNPAFGAGGKADITLGAGASVGRLQLLDDGRMLVGGSVLARVTADGRLDRTFGGGDGIVPVGAGGIAVQPDGRIVTADGVAVYRFTPDGMPDPTFGNGGRVTFNYPIGRVVDRTDPEYPDRYDDFVPKDVAWLSTSGRILVGGNTNSHWGVFTDFAVARLTPDGQLDRTFADGEGLMAADSDDIDIARRMAVAPSGLIAIAGEDYDEDTYVSVFDANGSWGDVGFFGYPGDANDVAFRPDGKLVVVGNVERFEPAINYRVADTRVACYDPLAPLAGNDWQAQVQLSHVYADDRAEGVAVAPDGDVLVAGTPGARAVRRRRSRRSDRREPLRRQHRVAGAVPPGTGLSSLFRRFRRATEPRLPRAHTALGQPRPGCDALQPPGSSGPRGPAGGGRARQLPRHRVLLRPGDRRRDLDPRPYHRRRPRGAAPGRQRAGPRPAAGVQRAPR